MADLTIFAYESSAVRTLDRNGEPWFVATDIAKILGYKLATDMAKMLDDDEKGMQNLHTLGGDQELLVVSESGLYAAILKSRRAEARKFRKWVTAEVLPSIRKTGGYRDPNAAVPPAPTFLTGNPSHGADLLVAADRTFRSFMRSGRVAGLRLPEALRMANRQTQARTGMDMLAEMGVEAGGLVGYVPLALDYGVSDFAAAWLGGALPLPATVCRSAELYAAYAHWRALSGEEAISIVRFLPMLRASAPEVSSGTRHARADGRFFTVKAAWIPGAIPAATGDLCARTWAEMEAFASALAAWNAAPG